MKTLNKVVLIGLSIGFSSVVFAEHFNDYSNFAQTPSANEQATVHPQGCSTLLTYIVSSRDIGPESEASDLDSGKERS